MKTSIVNPFMICLFFIIVVPEVSKTESCSLIPHKLKSTPENNQISLDFHNAFLPSNCFKSITRVEVVYEDSRLYIFDNRNQSFNSFVQIECLEKTMILKIAMEYKFKVERSIEVTVDCMPAPSVSQTTKVILITIGILFGSISSFLIVFFGFKRFNTRRIDLDANENATRNVEFIANPRINQLLGEEQETRESSFWTEWNS